MTGGQRGWTGIEKEGGIGMETRKERESQRTWGDRGGEREREWERAGGARAILSAADSGGA
jgi:hypothetical protein